MRTWLPILLLLAAGGAAFVLWSEDLPEGGIQGLEPGRTNTAQATADRDFEETEGSRRERVERAPGDPVPVGSDGATLDPTLAELDPEEAAERQRILELREENLLRRRAQLEKSFAGRATRIANDLNLGTGAEVEILKVYMEEHDRLAALRKAFAEGPRTLTDRDQFRAAMAAMPQEREAAFRRLFGEEVSRRIVAYVDDWGREELEMEHAVHGEH